MYPDANVMQATASACRPLLEGPADSKCKELRDWALKELIPEGNIDAAILTDGGNRAIWNLSKKPSRT